MDVSVIVPFYKGNQYMEQLFGIVRKNAKNAPGTEIELLLINDSPDCPIEYEESWIEGFTLRTLQNPQNTGIHGSRVNGIRAAKGDYVILLDQDDRLADNAVASQLAHIEDCDIVVSNGYNENEAYRGSIYHSLSHQRMVMEEECYYSIGCRIVSPGQCMLRAAVIPQVWLDKPIRKNGADDLLLWLLLLHTDCKWAVNPELLYIHVDTGENVSSNFDKMEESAFEVLDYLKELGQITPKQEKMFVRRFRMRRLYNGKGGIRKAFAMLCYPDIFLCLLKQKVREKQK